MPLKFNQEIDFLWLQGDCSWFASSRFISAIAWFVAGIFIVFVLVYAYNDYGRSSRMFYVRLIFLVYLEVLIFFECRVECKQHMKGFNQWVICSCMHWDIQYIACNFAVICKGQIDLFAWHADFRKHFLNFLWPHLHQRIDIWHWFRIWNWWRLFIFMDISNRINPSCDCFWILICVFNRMNIRIFASSILLVVV